MNEEFLAIAAPEDLPKYRRLLHRFMAFKHGRPYLFSPAGRLRIDAYPLDHQYTNDELLAITPGDICQFMCLMVYNKPTPTRADKPIYGRKNTLLYVKKALSYFMVNSLPQWDEQRKWGNPTKSKLVNKLIAVVKKEEVRGQGKKSSADRPFEPEEFATSIKMLARCEDELDRVLYPCLFSFQAHMIARLDGTCKLQKIHFRTHPDYDYILQTRLPWAKNCSDDRQAPWQIVVAGDDWELDVHLLFALFLETACGRGVYRTGEFVFLEEGDTQEALKGRARDAIRNNVLSTDEFKQIFAQSGRAQHSDAAYANECLGAHSNRKYGKTKARRSGQCTKDDADYRGRWKDMSHASAYVFHLLCTFCIFYTCSHHHCFQGIRGYVSARSRCHGCICSRPRRSSPVQADRRLWHRHRVDMRQCHP